MLTYVNFLITITLLYLSTQIILKNVWKLCTEAKSSFRPRKWWICSRQEATTTAKKPSIMITDFNIPACSIKIWINQKTNYHLFAWNSAPKSEKGKFLMKYSLKHPWKSIHVRKLKNTQKRSLGKVYWNIWSGGKKTKFGYNYGVSK